MSDESSDRQIWCRYAVLPGEVAEHVLISISDGVITAIERGAPEPTDRSTAPERLDGIAMAGFANAHSHAFHRALRGRTHRGVGNFWTWREQMYAVAARLTPDNYLALARATFAEMLLAGYTVVGEFHYLHHQPDGSPYRDHNAMGTAVIRAAQEAGIRLTLLDALYLRSGSGRPPTEEQLRFCDESASGWVARVRELANSDVRNLERVRIGAAIHSVRAVDAPSIATVAKHAHESGLPLHAHVSEQIGENDQTMLEYGCSPVQLLAQQGALSPTFTAVHATHLDHADLSLLGMAGCTACFCPTTERDLADGIGPSSELVAHRVALSIGSDQHAVIDPFEEIRAIEMNERLRSMERGTHSAQDLLRAGSANGYACLGWPDGGVIEVGALADLTTVSLASVRLAGFRRDSLLDAVVFAAMAADVDTVMVGGRTVVSGGRHVTIDVASELRQAIDDVNGHPL